MIEHLLFNCQSQRTEARDAQNRGQRSEVRERPMFNFKLAHCPRSLAAYPRSFTFYLTRPTRSILLSNFDFLLDGCSHGAIDRVVHPLSGGRARAFRQLPAFHSAIAERFRELVRRKNQRSAVSLWPRVADGPAGGQRSA